MDINLMVFLIAVALFGSVVFLGMAIADLEKQIRADREEFGQIVSAVDAVSKHCAHVLELMNGVLDTIRKEHDLHNQAVDAMREVENKAAEMRAEFEEMLIDIANNREGTYALSNQMTELTKRLDDFDALKNVSPTITNSVATVDDEQLKNNLINALKEAYNVNIVSDDDSTIRFTINPDGNSVAQREWHFDGIKSHDCKEEVKEADGSDFSNQLAAKIITPENAAEGTMMPDESVGVC